MSQNKNSRDAHKAVKKDGTVSLQQKAIYTLLSDGRPRTSRQISLMLNMERSSVCGRLNAMKGRRDKYKVLVSVNDLCPVTKKVVEWYTV